MGAVDKLVGRIPGVVLAVDDDLRVVAWNQGDQADLLFPATDLLGKPCYELMAVVDAETGGPCNESCPVVRGESRPGWAHSRVLEVKGAEGRGMRLDCLLLKCITPDSGKTNLCFLDSASGSKFETHTRVMRVIESIYPVVSSGAEVRDVLTAALDAVLEATSSDAGELLLLDRDTGQLVPVASVGLPSDRLLEFRKSIGGDKTMRDAGHSRLPLLATGVWPGEDSTEAFASFLSAPLVAEGRVLGSLGVVSRKDEFDVALATRVLFTVAAQLGVYLGWAFSSDDESLNAAVPVSGEPKLKIRCLGPFTVQVDGHRVPQENFHRQKSLTLLKFLVAHRGRPVPRETLMELLWPEADPSRAAANLRVVLHALRRTLEPDLEKGDVSSFVINQRDLVYLDPSKQVWADAEEFIQQSRRAAKLVSQGSIDEAVDVYRQASSLYKGDFLEDEPYSDWCLFERERLREVFINLSKQLAMVLAERDDINGAIDAYHSALGVDQVREEVHRELMLLYWKAGRRDEALRQFEVCRRILREELVVEPASETQTLYKAMLATTGP